MTQSGDRQSLLVRGWYVASEVEIAFMGLSGGAHDLLIIIKHIQGDHAESWPTQEHLARILKTSVRTIQRRLAELVSKGALICRRSGRATRYSVRYGHATPAEIRILMGADEVAIPAELVASDTTDPDGSDATHPDASLLYKNHSSKTMNTTPSLREGGGAGAPQSQASQEDEMDRYRQPALDELDPVQGLGLRDSQELPERPAEGPGVWWPGSAPTPAPTGRQRARSQAQLDTAMALAIELERQIRQADWEAGPAPVNRAALARNLSQWKADGVTADQIRAMIGSYVANAGMRSSGKVPWIDFVYKRYKLLAAVQRASQANAVESHRYDSEEYWLGSMAR